MEEFLRPYAVIFGSVALLFGPWWRVKRLLSRAAKGVAERTVAETRRRDPPATVAPGANAWSRLNWRSVNRPDAVACYRCRGDRSSVEGLQGRI